MSDALERARIAVVEAAPGDTDDLGDEASGRMARAALLAFLDATDGDEQIRNALLGGMGFYSDAGQFSEAAHDQARSGFARVRACLAGAGDEGDDRALAQEQKHD